MPCKCSCGSEYGFQPLGHWVCHKCGKVNDSGPYGHVSKDVILSPDEVDSIVEQGREFAGRVDTSLRAHPDAWEAWYALGATYLCRGNLLEAGLVWTRAAALMPNDGLEAFMHRVSTLASKTIVKLYQAGVKCNVHYAYGLEYACIHRLDGRVSYSDEVYRAMYGRLRELNPGDAFQAGNTAMMVLIERVSLVPDIREHVVMMDRIVKDIDAAWKDRPRTLNPLKNAVTKKSMFYAELMAEPYRMASQRASEAISGLSNAQLDELASKQPVDGTAGFTAHLMDAISAGGQLAYLKVTNGSEKEQEGLENRMVQGIDAYVRLYVAGDPAPVESNRIYVG